MSYNKTKFFCLFFFFARCSLMGYDLNRHWLEPNPWAHPTLYATKNVLMEADNSEVSQFLLFNCIAAAMQKCSLSKMLLFFFRKQHFHSKTIILHFDNFWYLNIWSSWRYDSWNKKKKSQNVLAIAGKTKYWRKKRHLTNM